MDSKLNVMKNSNQDLLNLMGKIIYLGNKCSMCLFKFDIWYFSHQQSEEVVEQLVCLNSSSLIWQYLQCMHHLGSVPVWDPPALHPLKVISLFMEAASASAKSAWVWLKVMSVAGGSKTQLSAELLVLPALKVSSVGAPGGSDSLLTFPSCAGCL